MSSRQCKSTQLMNHLTTVIVGRCKISTYFTHNADKNEKERPWQRPEIVFYFRINSVVPFIILNRYNNAEQIVFFSFSFVSDLHPGREQSLEDSNYAIVSSCFLLFVLLIPSHTFLSKATNVFDLYLDTFPFKCSQTQRGYNVMCVSSHFSFMSPYLAAE